MNLWKLYAKFPSLEYRHSVVMAIPVGGRLLEVGCSTGNRARRFKSLRPDLTVDATDISDFCGAVGPDIRFFQADITRSLPQELGDSYDCVTTTHLFEHLDPSTYTTAAREIARVLKPGGSWYVETPGIRSLWFPSQHLDKSRHAPLNFYDDPSHIKPFSEMGLYYLMKDHGFRVERFGVARNRLLTALSPMLVAAGLVANHRIWYAVGLQQLFGWSIFAHGKKA